MDPYRARQDVLARVRAYARDHGFRPPAFEGGRLAVYALPPGGYGRPQRYLIPMGSIQGVHISPGDWTVRVYDGRRAVPLGQFLSQEAARAFAGTIQAMVGHSLSVIIY